MNQQWDLMKSKICRKCVDGDGKGGCRLPVDDSCALYASFAEIAETVAGVHSESYQDYVSALRARVCAKCEQQFTDGVCNKRDTLECALDRYFPLVIDVIESMASQTPA